MPEDQNGPSLPVGYSQAQQQWWQPVQAQLSDQQWRSWFQPSDFPLPISDSMLPASKADMLRVIELLEQMLAKLALLAKQLS
jgi:hypothetical protein